MSRTFTIPIQYGPNGCQVNIGGNQTCRETQTLEIIKEFNRVYESKLHELNNIGCGDNLLAKVHLQQDWIRDLTQQNELLVRAVEELEKEAAERVSMLEERLQNGAQANEDVQKLDTKLKEMQKQLNHSPKETELEELNFKLHLKDEELGSLKRRCCDVEADSTELRTKFKELEKENTTLKDTIFQANRELEKFYEQANDCVKERDEYKRKYKEGTDALAAAQARFASDKQNLEKKVAGQEETIKKMIGEQEQLKGQLINCKRQSESLSQAQNETIQALQEAIHEKDKASEVVRVMPLTSEESWTSTATTTSKSSRAKTPQSENEKEVSISNVGLTEQETPSCLSNQSKGLKKGPDVVQKESILKNSCPAFDSFEELKKVQRERDYEREIHKQEVENLKKTIEELEKGGHQTQGVSFELNKENNQLRDRVEELECECVAMRRIVKEAKELHQSYILMQANKDDLQLETEQARKDLLHQVQLKDMNNARIEELQSMLDERTCEIRRCNQLLHDLQSKLCWTVCQNNQLKNEISALLTHVNDYEQNYIDNDERTDYCQKEIEVCKENLTDLKDKLLMMKGLLQQKIDQYCQLETEYCVQNNSLVCLKKQMCLNQKQYEDEVSDLRYTIDELRNNLKSTEATCKCLREDYQRSQAVIQEYSRVESKLQDDFTNSLNDAQNEIMALNNYVAQLKEECCCIKKELKVKEQQIGVAKAQIAHFKSSENAELSAAKDEIDKLRNELNEVVQQHEILKTKNEALCRQLCELKQTAVTYERQTQIGEHHMQKCVCELQHMRQMKEQLAATNEQLRLAYKELCQKYQQVLAALEKHKFGHNSRLHAGSNVDTLEISFPSDASLEFEENSSQSYTVIDNSEECSLDNYELNEPYPKQWLKKVESMTKELHESSQYWQSKMSDDYLVTKDN